MVSDFTVGRKGFLGYLKALADSKSYPIDLTLDGGYITTTGPDDTGQVIIPADIEGEGKVRIEGAYLIAALKACGGMVDFAMTDGKSPVMFTTDGYQLVVMPMLTAESKPEAATEPVTEVDTEEAEVTEQKPKRSRKREKVAVLP